MVFRWFCVVTFDSAPGTAMRVSESCTGTPRSLQQNAKILQRFYHALLRHGTWYDTAHGTTRCEHVVHGPRHKCGRGKLPYVAAKVVRRGCGRDKLSEPLHRRVTIVRGVLRPVLARFRYAAFRGVATSRSCNAQGAMLPVMQQTTSKSLRAVGQQRHRT